MNHTRREPPDTPRGAAWTVLDRVEHEGAFADRALEGDPVRPLAVRDRQFVRELVLGTLRWRDRFDRIVQAYYSKPFDTLDPALLTVLRMGLCQLIAMDGVPAFAAVNESVELARALRGAGGGNLVNAILRRFQREGEPPLPDDPAARIAAEWSHPQWLVERWAARWGTETVEAMCRAGAEKHPVFIRLNPRKADSQGLAAALRAEGFDPEPVPFRFGYLAVRKASGLFASNTFAAGWFMVQDPAAGMAVELLDPQPNEDVLDLCAAPGGKTTQIAERMGDTGRVTAVDTHKGRLGLVREAADRLELASVSCVTGDARTFGDEPTGGWDRVLLDAPCTGTGVLAKRPDMKWRLTPEDIPRMAAIQAELLDHAADLVRPGGVLVYSTCTMEPEENEDIVRAFLDRHQEFALEPDERFAEYDTGAGYRIFPHEGGGTGAYAALLRRSSA